MSCSAPETIALSHDEVRIIAVHEAGHATVAFAVGIDVVEIRIAAAGGHCTHTGTYRSNQRTRRRAAALVSLGGYFAAALHCRQLDGYGRLNSWWNCSEDLARFWHNSCGMPFRQGRTMVLDILRERQSGLLALARRLERDGFVDHTNAGHEFTGESAP